MAALGLYHPLDSVTNLKYKLLYFLTPIKKISKRKALAFDRDRCCHLAICLWLILFHCWLFSKCSVLSWGGECHIFGATTLSITTISIMTLSIMALSITTFNITINKSRHSAMTFSRTALMLSVSNMPFMLSVVMPSVAAPYLYRG